MKQFVALARVSSREQEREGFSLEVQEDALRRYATQAGGKIVKLFKIAETASKGDERTAFRELIAYAKKHCAELDGLLFYKVDRAARNLFDYVELERLESEYDLPFISVSQPTECTPAGRMMRRTLANMASFFTEQQSVDVREGLARRVQEGWFVGKAPYGYRNLRKDGRGIVEIDPTAADNVRRIFDLFAYGNCTLDMVVAKLNTEARQFRASTPKFPRSSVHNILQDRAYIGEIEFKGQWYPGKHEPLVDRATWNRVQALLGGHVYQSHALTYASDLIQCGQCGHPITGERKTKGQRVYVYYRCTYYNAPGHPRTRVTEADLDRQVLAIFDKMRIEDEAIRDWVRAVLTAQTRDSQADSLAQRGELQRQETLIVNQQDRLVNLRMADEIDQQTFARKQTELRDRQAAITLQRDVLNRSHDETADLAVKVFELSQTLRRHWLTADYATKRRILEIVLLNCQLDGASLCPTIRKPFDQLAEGLVSEKSRDDRI
ncbi:recombinase family protein [Anatilimnocola floriformis]|uniref:recombinase family protein n=1 Tax=Anatilimnocola floriformis TaxID=2948575 RepID=UPI0020C24FDF|nr:recombinase family protein [Anatilimnocola floriformis]